MTDLTGQIVNQGYHKSLWLCLGVIMIVFAENDVMPSMSDTMISAYNVILQLGEALTCVSITTLMVIDRNLSGLKCKWKLSLLSKGYINDLYKTQFFIVVVFTAMVAIAVL